jgi:plastocyanin
MYVRSSVLLLLLVLAVACAQPASSPTSPAGAGGSLAAGNSSPQSATMRFGNDSVGSGFPTPTLHDQSGHARDNLIPRTVTIDKGGTVTFVLDPTIGRVHQVGIFKEGTTPEDIDRSGLIQKPGCPFGGPLNGGFIDPTKPANASAFVAITGEPLCNTATADVPNQTHTFNTPGTYLVVCMFNPHLNLGMYGWVVVRDRP